MENRTIAVLVMVGVFLAYTVFIWFLRNDKKPKRGPMDSISDSVKILKGPWIALFSLFAICLAAPLAVFIEINGLFFIPMVCLGLLAAAPLLPDSTNRHVAMHLIGATGSMGSILIIIWIVFGSWWWLVIGLAFVVVLKRPKIYFGLGNSFDKKTGFVVVYNDIPNYTWWLESALFFTIVFGLK